mgnify:CR=1 FL=1
MPERHGLCASQHGLSQVQNVQSRFCIAQSLSVSHRRWWLIPPRPAIANQGSSCAFSMLFSQSQRSDRPAPLHRRANRRSCASGWTRPMARSCWRSTPGTRPARSPISWAMSTTGDSMLIEARDVLGRPNPNEFLEKFKPGGKPFVIAARVSGSVNSAYPDGEPQPPLHGDLRLRRPDRRHRRRRVAAREDVGDARCHGAILPSAARAAISRRWWEPSSRIRSTAA